MRRRLLIGPVALFAVVLVSLTGCGSGPVATPLTLSYPAATAGADPLQISLVDQTAMVTAIAAGPDASAIPGVQAVPGADTLRVAWEGGPCDDRATLVLNRIGGGRYELAIHNHPPITAGIDCGESTVSRVVDITFNRHLDPQELTLNVEYP